MTVDRDLDLTPLRLLRHAEALTRRLFTGYAYFAPQPDFFSVQSARYAVKREPYKGVDMAVYYHPAHPWNVERMLKALRFGLDYDQANFSPFQFRQARILEFPDYAQFAQSFANTIPYSEGIGFIADHHDPAKIDMVTYVTAHELGHQWWAHQVIGPTCRAAPCWTRPSPNTQRSWP